MDEIIDSNITLDEMAESSDDEEAEEVESSTLGGFAELSSSILELIPDAVGPGALIGITQKVMALVQVWGKSHGATGDHKKKLVTNLLLYIIHESGVVHEDYTDAADTFVTDYLPVLIDTLKFVSKTGGGMIPSAARKCCLIY